MTSFYEYLASVKREYKYKLKLAVPVDDKVMDTVERVLMRYFVVDVARPKKSILQRNEIDFPGVGPVETYTIQFVTEHPIVVQSLTNDIKKALNVAENYIRIRGENEPVAVEERTLEELMDIADAAGDDVPATLIGSIEPEEPAEEVYGDNYNQKLMNYLAQIQANRAAEMEKSGHRSMFSWLDTAQEDGSFNADHDGIRPVSGSTLKAGETPDSPANTAPTGNFDSRIKHAEKLYKSGDGVKKLRGGK